MTKKQTLHAWGALPWDRVMEILGDAQAAWADYEGFHIGQCPSQAPPYSHLWGWSGSWLFRVRIDGDEGIVAALGDPAVPAGAPTPIQAREVMTCEHDGIPWGDDGQVAESASALVDRIHRITLVETLEPMPVTFVSVDMKV